MDADAGEVVEGRVRGTVDEVRDGGVGGRRARRDGGWDARERDAEADADAEGLTVM